MSAMGAHEVETIRGIVMARLDAIPLPDEGDFISDGDVWTAVIDVVTIWCNARHITWVKVGGIGHDHDELRTSGFDHDLATEVYVAVKARRAR